MIRLPQPALCRVPGAARVAHLFRGGGPDSGTCGAGRAALLLEVVVALSVMVTAMGLLGAQLVGGLRMITYAEETTRATQLADRMLALIELDPNTVARFFMQEEIDGDFDSDVYPQYRGWFWRARVEDLPNTEGLGRVTIEILHQTDPDDWDDIDNARIVRQLHLLKADPGRINLVEDFGLDEEQAAMLMEMIPIPGLDPTAIDPQLLVSQPPELLLELLPLIMPLLGQFRDALPTDLSPGMLRELMGGNRSLDGPSGAGGIDALRDLIMSQLGGQISEEELNGLLDNVGRGGGGGGGRRPGGPGAGGGRPGRGGRERTEGPPRGRTIEDLDRQRDERKSRGEGR